VIGYHPTVFTVFVTEIIKKFYTDALFNNLRDVLSQ